MGPKLSVSVRVAGFGGEEGFDRAINHIYGLRARHALYFLRKRSSRPPSAPSVGLAGSSSPSFAGAAKADVAGNGAPGSSSADAAPSVVSNCRPNCTEGSKKLLI